jgi:hypothetical protein
MNVCRKCPNELQAFYWTVNSCASHSFATTIDILPTDVSTTWMTKEFHFVFGKKMAILQLNMHTNVGGGGLDMQLSMKCVSDTVNTQKYKYAIELKIDGG